MMLLNDTAFIFVASLKHFFLEVEAFKYSHASSIDENFGAAADPLTSELESGLR